MPKIVDRDARRREVITAVWRIIVRDGVEHASFREVAQESGLAIGSIRHFFGSHEDLIVAAAQEMAEQIGVRMEAQVDERLGVPGRDLAEAILEAVLPLDDERRDEAALWLALMSASRTNPALLEQSAALHSGVRTLVRQVINHTPHAGDEIEVERLAAVLDGLALGAVVHPELMSTRRMREVLRRHLDSLRGGAAAPDSDVT